MRLDYHIHTLFSNGMNNLKDYVDQAVKRKIDEIGFSDHMHSGKVSWSMNFSDLSHYVNRINVVNETSRIPIKKGLEVDFVPLRINRLMRTIGKFDLDYLIGSVHFIGNWSIDSEDQIGRWRRKNIDHVYQQYFKLVQNLAKSRLFDIIGHLDLVKIFNFRPRNDITSLLVETTEIIRKSKMCIELNTSGLRRPCCELYPSDKLLKICFENGIPVTLGSDAHFPEEVGADFDKAVSLLKRSGYVKIVRFSKRKREFVDL